MTAPQITVAVILAVVAILSIISHVRTGGRDNAYVSIGGICVWIALLAWGGFWS